MQTLAEQPVSKKPLPLGGNTDTSFLKVLALLLMLTDHLGAGIFLGVGELRIIGRMAFPLYAWCLVVGSVKTRNIYRYGFRLLCLGIISQPIYMIALSHVWTDFNILFALLVGLMAIHSIQAKWYGSQFWGPILCFVFVSFVNVDYGWRGLMFILVLYGARKTRCGLIAAFLAYALFWGASYTPIKEIFGIELSFLNWPGIGTWLTAFFRLQGMIWLSLPLIVCNTRTSLRMPQWLGYALYPMHLVLVILLKLIIAGADWQRLLSVF